MGWAGGFAGQAHRFLFWDPVRLIELFSGFNLMAWASLFWRQPELLARDTYAAFQGLGALPWAALLLTVALSQLAPVFFRFRHAANLRFVAMAAASGAWLVIASNFISTGVSTTAGANYLLLSCACMVSGAWLGWMSRNS
tara:strand:- start:9494 stop:9913 length:420 start_codon:yes stop_codon:yes gene_type:complete